MDAENNFVRRKRVAIIGAGASGLTAARQALDYDVEPFVFEASYNVGGLWNYKPHETEESSVMKSTVINTSKEMTAFSDYPPPPEAANFMHNRKMFDYLKSYCRHHSLEKYIRFGHKVDNIVRSPTYDVDGTWMVSFCDVALNSTLTVTETFDGVLLCTGHHTEPFVPPKWPGQEAFRGRVIHSHSYKDHRGYEDTTVAVVGVGNSGVDIAVELSRIAKEVYLVTRRGTWVLNRNMDYSEPFDMMLNRRYLTFFLNRFTLPLCCAFVTRFVKQRLNHARYGLEPKHHIFAAHWTVNDELSNRLSCGTIVVKPNIASFTERGLVFEDGTSVDNVDHVILSTGYSFGFPLVENGELIAVKENRVELYKHIFPLETHGHNTLAVIGCIQPLGSVMPISEMQARVFFEVFSGACILPPRDEMKADFDKTMSIMQNRYIHSRRHTIQVDYDCYSDELASIIGCNPCNPRYLLSDPRMALHVLFGPNYPYLYRLCGPKPWAGARDAVLDAPRRKACGMRGLSGKLATRHQTSMSDLSLYPFSLVFVLIVVGSALLFSLLF